MRIDVVTLFPEMFSALDYGITGRAIKNQILQVKFWNLRDFSKDKYRKVDESPYGGGAGMVMMMEPISKAISSIKKEKARFLPP